MDTEVKYTISARVPNHPWFDDDKSFVTEVWEYASFDMEDAVVREATSKGWQVYMVGDTRPAMVVFKKVTG